ncbi:MAG: hypothetical protein JNK72_27010 [Myxococcales bacterium]|nr:hypothetical protein [Myxococcales bacterium]
MALTLGFGALSAPSRAIADPLDLALNRLSLYNDTPWANGGVRYDPARWRFQGGCGTADTAAMGGQGYAQCFPDNQLWANLVNELGGALAPSLSAPAMTLGYAGIFIGYEVSVSNLNRGVASDSTQQYWPRGTEGSSTANVGTGTRSIRDRGDANAFVSRLHVRKGLPFGFELGTQVSHLHSSGIWAIGLDLRWALLEGFRHGLGYLPDIAVRGAVNTMVGQSQMNLTVVSLDATISKRFTLGSQVRLSPYLGGQALMIFGDSGVVDFTPSRSAQAECPRQTVNYVADTRAPSDPNRSPSGLVGQLACTGSATLVPGLPSDLNDTRNNGVFQAMRILRPRAFFGLQFQWEVFMLTGEFTVDVAAPSWLSTPPESAGRPNTNAATAGQAANTPITFVGPTQWMTTISAGFAFR